MSKQESASSEPARNLVGYGRNPPDPKWPGGARLAVQIVLNYEEGAESCILSGDAGSEAFLSEIIGARSYENMRHMSMESVYEYGSRVGFWRLHRILNKHTVPVTVFGVASALATNPEAVQAMQDAGWEIASHGYRWLDYQFIDIDTERRHLELAIELHEQVTGAAPRGWYTGRTSPNSRRLIAASRRFMYESDSYADELPYWCTDFDSPLLIIPYSLDCNDMRFATAPGFNSGRQFYDYLRDSFDLLYEEGESAPKMMSIGLHCRIAGRPGRARALDEFLSYARSFDGAWFCHRIDLANHWHTHHALKAE